jgi:hypothetical protein
MPGDPAVAVEERVNPQQAMVRRCRRKDVVGPAQPPVGRREAFHEARQRAGADRDMVADLHVAQASLPRCEPDSLAGVGVGDP